MEESRNTRRPCGGRALRKPKEGCGQSVGSRPLLPAFLALQKAVRLRNSLAEIGREKPHGRDGGDELLEKELRCFLELGCSPARCPFRTAALQRLWRDLVDWKVRFLQMWDASPARRKQGGRERLSSIQGGRGEKGGRLIDPQLLLLNFNRARVAVCVCLEYF